MVGDKISVTMDFHTRRIHWFLNNAYQSTMEMESYVTKLWAIAMLYHRGDSVFLGKPKAKVVAEQDIKPISFDEKALK